MCERGGLLECDGREGCINRPNKGVIGLTHFGYTTAVSRAVLMKCCMAADSPSPWC